LRHGVSYNGTVFRLFIDFKKAYDSVTVEFGILGKLVYPINMCLNETCSRVRIGKKLSDKFPVQNGLKQEEALSPLLFNFAFEYAIRKFKREPGRTETEWNTSDVGLC
jgi:hypothetical protein